MNIFVLCATNRGRRFLARLFALCPTDDFFVFSFPEESWEPQYLDDIRRLATDHGAAFFETRNVAHERFNSVWSTVPVDLIFVISWRYLIPITLAEKSRLGCIVFHDSLLPRYRGFAPTVWAMVNGENQTGVTMFHLAEAMDAGDIIDQVAIQIGSDDTIREVMDKVTEAYLYLLEKNLPLIKTGRAPRKPQDQSLATYTCKRMPKDNEIDWSATTDAVYNLIRAVTRPYPGAFTWYNNRKLTVWSASPLRDNLRYVGRIPGRVVEIRRGEGVVVLTGDGRLLIKSVQMEGEREKHADELITSITSQLGG